MGESSTLLKVHFFLLMGPILRLSTKILSRNLFQTMYLSSKKYCTGEVASFTVTEICKFRAILKSGVLLWCTSVTSFAILSLCSTQCTTPVTLAYSAQLQQPGHTLRDPGTHCATPAHAVRLKETLAHKFAIIKRTMSVCINLGAILVV